MGAKRPVSVLVVIHTPQLDVVVLERALHPGYWQSVTGSQEAEESLMTTAMREVLEETGIVANPENLINWHLSNRFEIFHEWRHRYADGVTHNTEHVFSLCLPEPRALQLAPDEHLSFQWLPYKAAAAKVFSWTNRDAILMLPNISSQ
ncbi:MAG: dihydroneopterin triphosphate diphosphatase [Rhodocyclaceae bacterium]|nr:dihydroneopterin triphosphate diphosphatase [Rhodocyclaceae bacterium]